MVYPVYNDYSIIWNTKPKLYEINKHTSINFVPMGFDIETSTIYNKDEHGKVTDHFSFMYCWQFSVGNNVIMGRTWKELSDLLNKIKRTYCKSDEKTIIFIANQSFEFSFMGAELHNLGHKIEVFARKKRKPMKIVVDDTIVFLDTCLITGYSLAKMAQNYCTTQKMVGDLDYNLVRLPATPLTKKETKYCVNDVLILSEYAQYYADTYLANKFIPMTSTMIASRVVKDAVKELKMLKFAYWLIKKCYPKNRQQYEYIMSFYTGAYTHGMLINLFITLFNVLKFDVCSEYPWALLNGYYPISPFKRLKSRDKKIIQSMLDTKCCLCDITLLNFRTTTGVTILSKNKVLDSMQNLNNENLYTWDNGRCFKAKSIRVRVTELDLLTLAKHSTWDDIIFNDVLYAKRGKLPKYLAVAITKLYAAKCKLKHDPDKKIEYAESKSKLNGIYGWLCTKLGFTEITFNDGQWNESNNDVNFDKMCMKKIALPQWAIYCTAHARYLILDAASKIQPEDYYYSDTDSIACANKAYIQKIFHDMNNQIRKDNQKWIDYYDIDCSEIDYAEMGTFDNETKDGALKRFKCLGSKRYLSEYPDGHIESTIAGLPKKAFNDYCTQNKLKPFDAFDDGLLVDAYASDKLVTYYQDTPVTKTVTDYRGTTMDITAQSYVSLIPTTFGLTVSDTLKMLNIQYNTYNDIKGMNI